MGAYKHITATLRNEYKERDSALKSRLIKWREEPSTVRIERPTNLARARELGYKAKQGVVLARVKIPKGMRKRHWIGAGRKPSKSGSFFSHGKSFQAIAEERAGRKYINCEVLNSYYAGEDGSYKYFEIILLDAQHPAVKSYELYGNVLHRKSRAFRGLTHSGRAHRHSMQR